MTRAAAVSNKAIMSSMRQLEIRTRRMVNDSLAGSYHSVFKGRGMDFDEVREYSAGDEVRTIDWNVTARAGRPFVKKFTEERELTIFLLVDISASGNFGSGSMSKRDLAAATQRIVRSGNHDRGITEKYINGVLLTNRVCDSRDHQLHAARRELREQRCRVARGDMKCDPRILPRETRRIRIAGLHAGIAAIHAVHFSEYPRRQNGARSRASVQCKRCDGPLSAGNLVFL